MDHGQNEFVLTSRFSFGALTLDLPVGLINPRIVKSRGLTILICLIFLPFVSGTFQIILTHGWNCKIFFRDKLVQFWNSSCSSFFIGHSNSDIYLWHLNFDIYFFLIFFIWTVNLLEKKFFSSLLSFLSLFFEPTDFEMAIWWTF